MLLLVGWLVLGRVDWFRRPGRTGYTTLIVSGALLAIAVEWLALHVLHRWSYAEAMPQLPVLNVGLVPVLQMLILPPLIFYAAARVAFRQ